MTRVLMTTDTVGGVWTYALELASALAPVGVEVTLATMGPPLSAAQRRAVASTPIAAVHESSFALEWMPDPWRDVERARRWLLDLEALVEPDVVHLNGYCHAASSWRAPTVVVAHSCVLSWWAAVRHQPAPPEWQEYQYRVAAGLEAAGAVVAPTSAMLRELSRWYGFTGGRVVANGRRSDWLTTAPKEPFVFTAGRLWDDAKNIGALSRVAGGLPWPIVSAGDTSSPDGNGRDAGADGVERLGSIPFSELAPWLCRAAVFALPARYEPFGLAALEAGLAGCALVLGDIPSLREVWGGAAVFVDPEDDDQLRAALVALADDPALRATRGAMARERAAHYSPARSAAGYHEIYRQLLGRTAPTAAIGVSGSSR